MKTMALVIFTFLTVMLLVSIFPASAYDFQHEDIWVYKGSFELGQGERASTERYTLKVYSVDQEAAEPSTVILLYKNKDFKKAYYMDAGPNNQQIYDDLKIKVVGIAEGNVSLVMYGHESEKVWVLSMPKVSLAKGDVMQDGAYAISVTNISSKEANISVTSPSGKYDNVFALRDYRKYDNAFMVRLVYIDVARSQAFIETYRPGKPDLEVAVSPSKENFNADEPVSCTLWLTNNGTLSLRGLKIENTASEDVLSEQTLSLETLAPLQTVALGMGLKAPAAATGRSISVNTKVSGDDYAGNTYYATDTQKFFVGPYISITKEINGTKNISGKTVASTHEPVKVSLKLKNMADLPVALTVTDKLPESFGLQNTKKPVWEIQMEPHSANEITYAVSPNIPGNFSLGNAVATWEENGNVHEVTSVAPQIQVRGSYVAAEKTLNTGYAMEGENVTVTLQVSNLGDQEVNVNMQDDLPQGADLVRGSLQWSGKLAPGEISLLSYNIVFSQLGEYVLPELKVDYTDKHMNKVTIYSNQPEIYVDGEIASYKNEEKLITSGVNEQGTGKLTGVQAAGFLVSSFVGLMFVISMIPVAVLFLISKVYK